MLAVWLPLINGNRNNLGTIDIGTATTNATIVTGKLGNCYQFARASQHLLIYTLPSELLDKMNNHSFGAAAWVKSTINSVWLCITYGILFKCDGFTLYNSSRSIHANASSGTAIDGNWHHVAYTYDVNTNKMTCYRDGIKVGENTYTSGYTYASSWNNNINIGRDTNGATEDRFFDGCIQDVRIWCDECPSAQQIKQISQGLILHYLLNDTLVLTNAFSYPTFNTSESSGGWLHWGPSGATATWSQNTNPDYIFNKNNTYSHKFLHTGGSYFLCYQSPDFEGGYRSALAIIKMEGGEYPHNVLFTHNANVGTNPPNTFTSLGNGFYLMKHEGFQQDGSNDLVAIYIKGNVTVYISEVYLENDRKVCSDIVRTTDTVYDVSGYGNNGTVTGTLINDKNTPRYDKSTYISEGVSNYIVSSTINIPGDAITVNIWIKSSNTSPTGSYHMPFESGEGSGYMEMSIGSSGFLRGGLYVNGSRYVQNSSGVNVLDGNWHMISMTYDGSVIKRYIDGVLNNSTSVTGTLNVTSHTYYFGKRGTSNSYASKEMYISDARLYSTALSADDIKELYNTAAFIDNKGNVSCYLFYEDTNSQITKTGQVLSEEFEEISDLSDGVAKVYELKIECNQLIEI